MRLVFSAFLLCPVLGQQVQAQTALDLVPGLYGSLLDPAQSCDSNPHEITLTDSPPHLVMQWDMPRRNSAGRQSLQDIYDLRDASGNSLTLQREGDHILPETGRRPVWILRLTQNPSGYCWGRSDWSPVRCIEPAIRCDSTAPTS